MEVVQLIDAIKVPLPSPGNISNVVRLVESGVLQPRDLVAVIGKTEGSGAVSDSGRESTERALVELCVLHCGMSREEVAERVNFVLSGGCPGLMSPHLTLFTRQMVEPRGSLDKRLVIGVAKSRELMAEEIGRMGQVDAVADAVRVALADAGVLDVADVHYVQVKNPALTPEAIRDTLTRGKSTVSDSGSSMTWSSDAAALGVAVALGEVPLDRLSDSVIRKDFSLFSRVASTSAGGEKKCAEVVLLANKVGAASAYRIGHDLIADLVDADGVRRAIRSAGIAVGCSATEAQRDLIVNVFAKAKVPSHGTCRGRRFCMLDDADIGTKPVRAIVNALVASVTGDTMNYVSGGELDSHQAPPDAMQCAAIVRVVE